jgi:hypothetical protein
MDITTMLNNKGPGAAAAPEHTYQPTLVRVVQCNDRSASEAGSEFESSSEQSSAYSIRPDRPLQAMPHVPNGVRYPSPIQGEQPMSLLASGYSAQNLGIDNDYGQGQYHDEPSSHPGRSSSGNDAVKAFACTTCGKGFARRSDLARHGKLKSVSLYVEPFLILFV